MAIIIVAAMSKGGLIGNGAELPWGKPIREDMVHFRKLTIDQVVVMGRRTWESIGSKPLKGRKSNIVLTRNKYFLSTNATTLGNADAVLELAKNEDVFIIGGAEIYSIFMPYAVKMYLTLVELFCPGDVYFPMYSRKEWKETERRGCEQIIDNRYSLEFVTLERTSLVI